MAWMIVARECNFRRGKHCLNAKPSPVPQRWPRAFVDYCVSIGRATEVKPPNREQARQYLTKL